MHYRFRLKKSHIIGFSIYSFGTLANQFEEQKTRKIPDQITIVATGNQRDAFSAPFMTTTIDAQAPINRVATTAADLVRNIPGLQISGTSRSNGQDISLRGYDQRGVLILLDGVRGNMNTGHLGTFFIDPALVKRVEVLRGPNATLYGSNAMGGVISYETINAIDLLAPNQSFGARAYTGGASLDRSLMGGLTLVGKNQDLDGLLSLNYRHTGDIHLSTGGSAPSRENISSMLAKANWYIDQWKTLSANLRYYNNDALEPQNPQEYQLNNDALLAKRLTITRDIQIKYAINAPELDWLDFDSVVYHSDTAIGNNNNVLPYQGRGLEKNGIKLNNRQRLFKESVAPSLLTYGIETYREYQKPSGVVASFPDAKIDFRAAWLQDEITLRDLPISIVAGLRYDNYRSNNTNNQQLRSNAHRWSPRIALSISPTDWLLLFTSYAEAFRAPTLSEMYDDSLHYYIPPNPSSGRRGIIAFFQPNPGLRPETAKSAEIGFGLQFDELLVDNDNLTFKSSYFHTDAQDFINYNVVTVPNSDPTTIRQSFIPVNVGQAEIWGFDVTSSYDLNWLTASVAYNHTVGKNKNNHTWLANINPDIVNTNLVWHTNEEIDIGWKATYAGAYTRVPPRNGNNIIPQSGYATHDLYISWQPIGKQGLTVTASINNIFDKTYYLPLGMLQDGRNIKLFVSYQW